MIDGINVEIYNVNESKIEALTNNNTNGMTMIQGENGIKEEALVFKNIVILKCENSEMQKN